MKKHPFAYFLFVMGGTSFFANILGFFLPIYFKQIGLSGLHTGSYFAISSIALLAFSLPMGVSTDRRSIRIIFMLSFFLISLSFVGFVISRAFLVFCLFAFLGSFGRQFSTTAANSMFFKIGAGDTLRNGGLFLLLRTLPMGAGMVLGGWVIEELSFGHLFVLAIAGNAVLALLAYLLPRTESVVIELGEYRKSVLTPRALFLAAVFALSSLHWGAEMISYGPFLKDNLGLTMNGVGVYTGLGLVVVGAGAWLGVVLLKRKRVRDMRHLLMLGLLISGVGHVLMCIPDLYWSFSFRALHEIGDGFVMLIFYHGISRVFHVDRIGGCAAFITLCMGVSSMASSILFGHVGDVFGHQWPLITSGLTLVALAGVLALNYRRMAFAATT